MNDLERDLQHLFEQRARDVDPAGLAPEAIIRRGHRRQARTVVGGVLASVVAIAVAVAAVGSIDRPSDRTPGGPQPLPARSTTIGGVPVTAPAGWTLVDDWPLGLLGSTSSQSCTFSGSGSAIPPDGSPIQDSPQQEFTQSCSSEPTTSPVGLPVLQLANFEIPLMETVCGLGPIAPTPLPADGVAVYVAAMGAVDTAELEASCPGTENVTESPVVTTFAAQQVNAVYAAVTVAGSQATDADLQVARDYMEGLGGIRIPPAGAEEAPGPGYVLAAGTSEGVAWRLEAGIIDFGQDGGEVKVGATMATSDASGYGWVSQAPPSGQQTVAEASWDAGGGGVVQWGTATSAVEGIDLVTSSATTAATLIAWPDGVRSFPGASGSLDGSVWYALASERGNVLPRLIGGPTAAPTASPTNSSDRLKTRETDNGDLVVYGYDLGHDWQIRHHNGELQFFLDGANTPDENFSFTSGASTAIDVEGGTFLIGVFDPSVTSWAVAVDATDAAPTDTIDGRYAPAQDATGRPANLWLIALPDSGTGTASGASSLPTFVSWPANLYPDGLFGAGSDGVVSWGIAHHSDQCALVKVIGADPSDSGTSDCLPSWYELNRNGDASPLIGGVYGQETATVVVVVFGETPVAASGRTIDCFTVRIESNFANTEFCVFSLPVGESTTVAFGEKGDALGGPIQLSAQPGSLDLGNTTPTGSP